MNTAIALLTAAEEVDEWAENARRYRATVADDSIEYATATARMMAYERVRDSLRRHADEFACPVQSDAEPHEFTPWYSRNPKLCSVCGDLEDEH